MTVNKNICEAVLNEGTVLNKDEFECEGIAVECYLVEYLGEKYTLTKHDGEWIYFHHH